MARRSKPAPPAGTPAQAFGRELATLVRGFVDRRLADEVVPLAERIAELEAKVLELEARR
jgi:hypothetical protein